MKDLDKQIKRNEKLLQQQDNIGHDLQQMYTHDNKGYKKPQPIHKKQISKKDKALNKWRSKMNKVKQSLQDKNNKVRESKRSLYNKKQDVYIIDIQNPNQFYQTKFQITSQLMKYYKHIDSRLTIKVQITSLVQYKKILQDGTTEYPEKVGNNTKMIQITNQEQIQDVVHQMWTQWIDNLFHGKTKASGYIVDYVDTMQLHILPYEEKNIGQHIKTKDIIQSIYNIQNQDNYCFIYCYMLSLYLKNNDNQIKNAYKPSNYKFEINDNILHMKSVIKMQIDKKVDISTVEFPFQIKHINKLEKIFDCSISLYQIDHKDNKKRYPIQINTNPKEHHIDLAIIQDENMNSHCMYIKNIHTFKAKQNTESKATSYSCNLCMYTTQKKPAYDKHIDICKKIINGGTDVYEQKMPQKGDDILKFTNFQNMNRNPYKIYADFECILQDIPSQQLSDTSSESSFDSQQSQPEKKTKHIKEHIPISYCIYFKSYKQQDSKLFIYKGLDCVDHFFNLLKDIQQFIELDIKENGNKDMIITEEQQQEFNNSTHCYLCKKEYTKKDKKVRDHDHYTGLYRGSAHNVCNLQYNISTNRYKVPVLFHNLKGYDSHFLIDKIYDHIDIHSNFSVLAQNSEKFISFQWNKYRFIDSFAFLPSSISKLANNLTNDQKVLTKQYFNDLSDADFIKFNSKGIFPYSWFDSEQKLQELQLPSQKDFYDDLNDNHCSDDDYKQAQWVWQKFNCKKFEDYHDLYLKMDVLLLVDVFEQFIDTCMTNYRLDPSYYYTSPGLSWDAMLLFTQTEFQLLTDLSMHLMIERGMRGGISTANHRYAMSNNKYQQDYDKNKESSYVQYHDANNLYGWAMCQKLPLNDFKWIKVGDDLQKHIDMITNYDENSDYGYFIDCNIHYPKELHDYHNNLPMCPEQIITGDKISKLTPNLHDKENYVAHIRNLQYYVQNGLIITKIHRIIKFHQQAYLKPYIEKNTNLRKQAKNAFEKDFFKLMNNSVFGKTMENVRGRANIKAITSKKQYNKALQNIQLKGITHINNNLSLANFSKLSVTLNKPVYCGASILDFSKLIMYRYLYQHIYKLYDYKDVKLCYMDTDSFILNIKTDDFYKDMIQHKEQYDLSEYSQEHPVYQLVKEQYPDNYQQVLNENKKVVGLMKDECGQSQIKEVIAIRSKMYTYKLENQYIGKRLKGLKTNVTNKEVTFDNYKDCLFNDTQYNHNQKTFKSLKHKVTTIHQNKVSLDSKNDKRHMLDDKITSLAIGHYKIE